MVGLRDLLLRYYEDLKQCLTESFEQTKDFLKMLKACITDPPSLLNDKASKKIKNLAPHQSTVEQGLSQIDFWL